MGNQINLLSSLPKSKRNLSNRTVKKSLEIIKISKQYGKMYFDGPREYGYGGYKYDGRWVSVARDIIKYYGLKKKDRVLDIGCAKGFLVNDLMNVLPGLEVFGLDVSDYAIKNSHPEVIGRIHKGSADHLPFSNNSFDLVISLDTIHNLTKNRVIVALQEIQRVTKKNSFIRVDSYRNEKEKKIFEDWVLTAECHDYPNGWLEIFKQAGYKGDYYWTIIN